MERTSADKPISQSIFC